MSPSLASSSLRSRVLSSVIFKTPIFAFKLYILGNLSSITLFEEHAKEGGKAKVETANVEASDQGSNQDDGSEASNPGTIWPGDFGKLHPDLFEILHHIHGYMLHYFL